MKTAKENSKIKTYWLVLKKIRLKGKILTEPQLMADVFNNYLIKSVSEISKFTVKPKKGCPILFPTHPFTITKITNTKVINLI